MNKQYRKTSSVILIVLSIAITLFTSCDPNHYVGKGEVTFTLADTDIKDDVPITISSNGNVLATLSNTETGRNITVALDEGDYEFTVSSESTVYSYSLDTSSLNAHRHKSYSVTVDAVSKDYNVSFVFTPYNSSYDSYENVSIDISAQSTDGTHSASTSISKAKNGSLKLRADKTYTLTYESSDPLYSVDAERLYTTKTVRDFSVSSGETKEVKVEVAAFTEVFVNHNYIPDNNMGFYAFITDVDNGRRYNVTYSMDMPYFDAPVGKYKIDTQPYQSGDIYYAAIPRDSDRITIRKDTRSIDLDIIELQKNATDSYTLTGYYWNNGTHPVIPASVNGTNITEIGGFAFNNGEIETISLPDTLTTIAAHAFFRCRNLQSIEIPDSVSSIGEGAFNNCDNLTSVTLPNNLQTIGGLAFNGCRKLNYIELPKSIESIGSGAFWSCVSLTSITIPENVTSINDNTFYKCTSLGSIEIPESVTEIGSLCFAFCENLKKIELKGEIQKMGYEVFDRASNDLVVYFSRMNNPYGNYPDTWNTNWLSGSPPNIIYWADNPPVTQ